MTDSRQAAWWKEAVVYQIYPRSFQDSNGDGIGDLPGILSRVDYLAELGIDVVWLSPVYQSPNVDNGYDIADYRAIMDEFGTMDDFDALLEALHARDIRLMMDLVVNHTSDQHAWFQAALGDAESPTRDFYIWHDPAPDGGPPNDWRSFFSGPAWTLDSDTQQYYLHLFAKQQPDLNWENPALRQRIYDMMRFWLDKGVDGFRMDVIPFLSKRDVGKQLADWDGAFMEFYANGPRIHDYLQEMHREVLGHYDVMTVGEAPGVSQEQAPLYVGADRNELNMIFHFDHFTIDRASDNPFKPAEWSLSELKRIFSEWDHAMAGRGWNSVWLGNHDLPRIVSRFGNAEGYREASAKLLATLLLTFRGTPYIYQGDEIGMTNTPFESIDEYRDIQAHNAYREREAEGGDTAQLLEDFLTVSRDHARTPVAWDDAPGAGFTEGTPWIKLNPIYPEINVSQARAEPRSIWRYYQKLIELRHQHPTWVYGDYQLLESAEDVWAYLRTGDEQQFLVVLNFSDDEQSFDLPDMKDEAELKLIAGNYAGEIQPTQLRPWEAQIWEVTGGR